MNVCVPSDRHKPAGLPAALRLWPPVAVPAPLASAAWRAIAPDTVPAAYRNAKISSKCVTTCAQERLCTDMGSAHELTVDVSAMVGATDRLLQ